MINFSANGENSDNPGYTQEKFIPSHYQLFQNYSSSDYTNMIQDLGEVNSAATLLKNDLPDLTSL